MITKAGTVRDRRLCRPFLYGSMKGEIHMQNFANYFAEFTNGAIALRLLLAAVLGCVIGLERATKHHPAGMRTFALVCLGAAASAVVNIYLGTALGVGSTDMGRIPAGVVSGIGFLGVGTIIITGKNQVRGLTTAAGLCALHHRWRAHQRRHARIEWQ